jgi:hypothetical protein
MKNVLRILALVFFTRLSAQFCYPSGHSGGCVGGGNIRCCSSCQFVACDDDSYNCYYCLTQCANLRTGQIYNPTYSTNCR